MTNLQTHDETTTNMSSLSETVHMVDNLRTEVIDILRENQVRWQKEMKEMITELKRNRTIEDREIKVSSTPISFKSIITEMKEEFKTQMNQNNLERERRLEQQKKSDEDWDRRMRTQHTETKITIDSMITTMKEMCKAIN